MSDLRRLALSVLMPGFDGRTAPDWLKSAIDDGLGSVCYFGHNISPEPADTRALSDDLHARGVGLIAVDEEGGTVSRLGTHHGSPHLGAAALGAIDDLAVTTAVASAIGRDVHALGIDLDFAPVADVDNNPLNPVIGIRSFGADPARVGEQIAAYVRGLQSQGVAGCAKHFPGHGDTAVDSHLGLPRIDHDRARLDTVELVPFRAAVDAGVQAIMTAHIVFAAVDPDQPATTSPAALSLLRDDLGFEGVIVTDALDMRAIRDGMGMGEGCVRALAAGADVIALGNAVFNGGPAGPEGILQEAVSAVTTALESGRLALEQLHHAARRLQALRDWAAGPHQPLPAASAEQERAWAAASLTARGALRSASLRILDARRARNIAAGALNDVLLDEVARRLPGSVVIRAFARDQSPEGHGDDAAPDSVLPASPEVDLVLTGTLGVDPVQDDTVRAALLANPEAILVCAAGDDRLPWSNAWPRVVRTHGHSIPTAAALADLLAASAT
ncbi:beta-N-acetylhexosaminidase [Branchiibius hedensis]|uniref:Beta-N-acetylhexosaminidase n=1 Tax=Branchiibius hedensis TaxID=672460 RepID=A0A2Y8ZSG7_9MICO|nr:glycoside hydrolase family 3 N-terminal domain-containing protein [Branchiibius hedensis]PWJ25583.1 beta-N-acetylhexosaminidase [Branchiibius hedensis]SSA34396.1 beta-N-acetylhexosaminidase [Branchiibius hedensis]